MMESDDNIKFDAEHMPELLNSIVIHFQGRNIVAEVAQHVGDDVARFINSNIVINKIIFS